MLQLIALLTLLIPFPVWALMIARPNDPRTRQIAGSYYVFILLGVLYVFLLVGSLFAYLNLQATLSSALDTATGAAAADAATALTTAVKGAGSTLGTLAWVVLAGGGIMDLLGGHFIYHDTRARGLSTRTSAIFLLLTYILGAVGFAAYIAWRFLFDLKTAPTPVTVSAPPIPPPPLITGSAPVPAIESSTTVNA